MREVSFDEFKENAFNLIGKEWLIYAAEKDGKVNAMTASWGGLGIMWNKKVAYIFVRPQRYTKEFIDASDRMSISVLPESLRKTGTYFGRTSGRDEDKIEKSGLTVMHYEDVPYFYESRLTMICKKLYAQSLDESSFLVKSLVDKCYPDKDFHVMYVVEIEKILEN